MFPQELEEEFRFTTGSILHLMHWLKWNLLWTNSGVYFCLIAPLLPSFYISIFTANP